MLVLSRKAGESIVIDGGITITVLEIRGRHVRLGIRAPEDMSVLREELATFKDWTADSPDAYEDDLVCAQSIPCGCPK
jgi:carbon storage regulator